MLIVQVYAVGAQPPQRAFDGPAYVFRCGCGPHRGFWRESGGGDRNHLREAWITGDGDAPSDCYYRDAEGRRPSEHPEGQFAHQRLPVNAPLACDYQVGVRGKCVESQCVQQQFCAGDRPGVQISQHSCAKTSSGPGALCSNDAASAESLRDRAEIPHPALEPFEQCCVGAFLWCIDHRRAFRAA